MVTGAASLCGQTVQLPGVPNLKKNYEFEVAGILPVVCKTGSHFTAFVEGGKLAVYSL